MTESVQLLGSYWTLAVGADPQGDQHCKHDFRRRVEVAAAAGFTAMGFWHADLLEIRRQYSFAEMHRILKDNGIVTVEVEWLLDWYYRGGDARRTASDATRKLLLEAAEALGAIHIKVSDLGNEGVDAGQMAEEFGRLCADAAARGTRVVFEMLPAAFSRLPSLDHVLGMIRGSGARNGGIMLDNLHLLRTDTPMEDIVRKIGSHIPLGVEINDGLLYSPRNFTDSVVNKRLLPGDGEFDIAGFLHALWSQGYRGPVGVEVLNEYARKWSLETAATEAFTKTHRVVSAALQSWQAGQTARM